MSDAWVASQSPSVIGIADDSTFHTVVSLTLPAGIYALVAKGRVQDVNNNAGVTCELVSSVLIDFTSTATAAYTGGPALTVLSLIGTAALASSQAVTVSCETAQADVNAIDFKILAMSVGTLH